MKTTTKTGHLVSTVPMIDGGFESMVFINGDEVDCIRTPTEGNAKKAHKHLVSLWSMSAASYWSRSAGESVKRAYLTGNFVTVVAR